MTEKELYKRIINNNGDCYPIWCDKCKYKVNDWCKMTKKFYFQNTNDFFKSLGKLKINYCHQKLREINRAEKLKRILK